MSLQKNKDKIGRNFPIKIETTTQIVFDQTAGSYKQFIVAANGFVVAHFVSEIAMKRFLTYLQNFNFTEHPKEILNILEKQHNSGAVKRLS